MAAAIKRVGFVGIGNMGWPMAANLLKAGFDVAVCDAVPARAAQFASEVGGRAAASATEAARGAECVVTMLPTSAQVAETAAAMAEALAPGALVIDMTSGQPGRTREIAASLATKGVQMVDNLVSAGGFLIAVEALLMGQRFGLDAGLMVDVLNASTGMNNSTQKKMRQFVLSRRFDAGFGLDLMVKDLSIALEVGRDTGTPTPFAALCREMWAGAAAMLGPGQDHTAMAQLSERLAGEVLGGNK